MNLTSYVQTEYEKSCGSKHRFKCMSDLNEN